MKSSPWWMASVRQVRSVWKVSQLSFLLQIGSAVNYFWPVHCRQAMLMQRDTWELLHVFSVKITNPIQFTVMWFIMLSSLVLSTSYYGWIEFAQPSLRTVDISSCPGSSIPTISRRSLSHCHFRKFGHKKWLLRLETLQTFNQSDIETKRRKG